jgi:hypothetical protein
VWSAMGRRGCWCGGGGSGKEDRPTVLAIVKALADELTVIENVKLSSHFVATLGCLYAHRR